MNIPLKHLHWRHQEPSVAKVAFNDIAGCEKLNEIDPLDHPAPYFFKQMSMQVLIQSISTKPVASFNATFMSGIKQI